MAGPRYASAKNSIACCDRCGFQFKLSTLRHITIKDNVTEIKVCRECWEPSHPQLRLGEFPVYDPQAVKDPRPDLSYAQSRAIIIPVFTQYATGFTGNVTISIS